MKALARVLATVFGLGLIPLAPGTAASLVAAVAYKLALHRLPWALYVLILVILVVVGVKAAGLYAAELGRPDPGRIVIDEVCGQLVALAFLPGGWVAVGLSFALFRFFDIIKPGPIRRLERLSGGWGIMADDLGAGIAAAVVARLVSLII
jgi:phosphatidylglycerophosphatase A